MSDREQNKKRKVTAWLVVGVVVLIFLLLFWVDIADILGAGDGASMITLFRTFI